MLTIIFATFALLVAIISGPAWSADPAPPNESSPFDVQRIALGGRDFGLHKFRNPNAGLAWFNSRLRDMRVAGDLQSCRVLVGLYLTRYDEAFGGVCRLNDGQHTLDVTVCADTGVGNFRLVPLGTGNATPEAITEFVASNCAGG